ncbi:putative protein OS=Streptomyces microflavus OX=1919 GN=Smic_00580 PE=4 SV=1 [Streptomyces microflavus]
MFADTGGGRAPAVRRTATSSSAVTWDVCVAGAFAAGTAVAEPPSKTVRRGSAGWATQEPSKPSSASRSLSSRTGQCRLLRPVVPAGDLGGHAADGVGAALVAGADQEFGVGRRGAVMVTVDRPGDENSGRRRAEVSSDQAKEEVVPAARVEAGAVVRRSS